MNLTQYLASRGVPEQIIDDLLPYVPERMQELAVDDFCDATRIMTSETWFYWPAQTRFVLVGECLNGDGVAIDTQEQPGAVFYIAHELLGGDRPLAEIAIRVADSPSDYVRKRATDDFPWDFWEAKAAGNAEPSAGRSSRSEQQFSF